MKILTDAEALDRYARAIKRLEEVNRGRDEEAIQEMMADGMTRDQAELAIPAIYYGGDCVNLDDPMWQDPE